MSSEKDEWIAAYRRADAAIADERFIDAVRELSALLTKTPDEVLLHWRIGYVFYDMGDVAKAMDHFKRSIELDAECVPAWGGLGQCYGKLGLLIEAEESFRKRLSLKESAHQHVFLAIVLGARNRPNAAIEECNAAIRLDRTFEEAYYNLGRFLELTGNKEKAAEAFQHAIQLDPNYAIAYRHLGLLEYGRANFDVAERHVREALRLSPDCGLAHCYLGLICSNSGRTAEAEAEFEKALRLAADTPIPYKVYADFCRSIGRSERAQQLEAKSDELQNAPEQPGIW